MRFIVVALIAQLLSIGVAALAQAQQDPPDFSGIWSDPLPTPENLLCFMGCTDAGIEYLNALLDDPNNDDRPFSELNGEAAGFQVNEHTRSFLTTSALEGYPVPLAEDPGLTECRPWGFARQILIAHQMEVSQYEDRVEFYYVGWDTLRTVYLDGREPQEDQPTRMGHSLGR